MNEDELVLKIKSHLDASGFSQVKAEMGEVESRAGSFGGTLAKGLGVATLAAGGLALAVVGIGKAAMSLTAGNAEFERYETQLGTLLGSADAAKERMKELAEFGAKTPFELPEVVRADKVLTGFGLDTEKTTKLAGMNLKDFRTVVGDVAAGTGASFEEIALTFGKFSAGATGKAIARLQELGVVTKEQMAAVGIEFSKGGEILSPLPEAFAAAVKIAQDKFGGGMDKLSATFEGQMSTLSDTWTEIKRTLAEPIFDALKAGLDKLLPALGEFTPAFKAAKEQGLDPLHAALDGVAAVLAKLGIEGAEAKVKAFGDAVTVAAAFVKDELWPALKNVGDAVVAVTGFLVRHKDVVLGVVAAFVAFKTALAISAGITNLSAAISATQGIWAAYKAGTLSAAIGTNALGAAVKLALGPIGWITLAVGVLAAAWAGNWGGIREKTAAVVEWIKTIPAQLVAGWTQLKADLLAMVAAWAIKWAEVKAHPVKAFGEVLIFLGMLPVKMMKLGVDIIMGIFNGLKQAWQKVKSWFAGAADEIPSAFHKRLDMRSPSRVMYQIGFYIMEGLSLGISASTNLGVAAAHSAVDSMLDVFNKLADARVAVAISENLAAAAKAAVDAALAADGVIRQGRETSAEAWARYYDEMTERENELHDLRMADVEAQRKAALDSLEAQAEAAKALGEAEGIRVARLIQNQRDTEQKTGAPQSELKEFDRLWRQSAENLRSLLETLHGGPIADIEKAFRDFWVNFNGGAVSGIANSQQLTEAIAALIDKVGEKYDDLHTAQETFWDGEAKSEEDRHRQVLANLAQRKELIDALIKAQEDADANLADLIAIRDRLLQEARSAVAAAQKAAEEAENRIHKGVMDHLADERKAVEAGHKFRMALLTDEKRAIDAAHERRMRQIQDQRDHIEDGFKDQEKEIAHNRSLLDRLKLDLGVEAAANKLAALKDQLNDLLAVAESFQVSLRGKDANDAARKAIVERTRITTDAQRLALQAALDSGTLDEKDRRRVELLLLGRGTQRLTDVKRILEAGQEVLKGQVDYQQAIVDANDLAIKAREHIIELAEQQLKLDKDAAIERLDALEKQARAEDERYARETKNIDTRIELERQRYEAELAFIDSIMDAETRRHEQRMTDIASEYALELARLGMTQAEIDAMVRAAQAEAERIAAETERRFKELRDAASGGTAGGTVNLPGLGGSVPVPITGPGNGGPIGGLRPGGGAVTLDLTGVEAKEAKVEKVDFGGMSVTSSAVLRLPSGREIALETVDALLDDVTLLDKLGKKLNERKVGSGQIGGGP